MKRIKILFLLIINATIITSCNDYLDLTPISESTTENAYQTATQIEAALLGVYESFQSSEYYVWDFLNFQDVRADNAYAGGDNPELFQIDLLEIPPTHTRLFTHWSNLYNAISKANLVLERVDDITDTLLTEERREQIRGEAYFLRAYHYFTLVKMWGGVPLILNTVQSTDAESINIPRSTVEEVYAQIFSDLNQAAILLPEIYGDDNDINKARATAGAAHALAAKATMQQPVPDYSLALTHIQSVESSVAAYNLISYNELFNLNADNSNDNNAESILEVQYIGENEGSFGPQLLLPPSLTGDSWRKFVTPSHDLMNAFTSLNDNVRRNTAVLFENVNWADEYWGNSPGTSIPFSYKWKNAFGFASTDNVYLLRYGDIVLLKAEALNESGQLSAAVTEVNRIRNRAQLPPLTSQEQSSQEVLRTTILNERRLELFLEGHRWDDLVRNNRILSVMNNLNEVDLRTGNRVIYNMTEAKILLPIPQQELDRNPALVQNPL